MSAASVLIAVLRSKAEPVELRVLAGEIGVEQTRAALAKLATDLIALGWKKGTRRGGRGHSRVWHPPDRE